MDVRSITKYARISPKKARDVAREIQGLPVSDALDTLNYTPKKAAALIGKTLRSAIANAEHNNELSADELIVKEAVVTDGPTMKRFKPRARGSAGAIRKRSSHIFITITDEFDSEQFETRERISRKDKKRNKVAPMFGAKAAAPAATEASAEEETAETAE